MEITTELFLTATGLALVVAILVQLLKRWLRPYEEQVWHGAAVNTVALLLGFVASLIGVYANRLPIDGPVIAFLLLQGIIIGALATGGYEWVSNLILFVGGVRSES